jgi:hypothetical protein
MRIATENTNPFLTAALLTNTIVNAIAEAIYASSARRALRAIRRGR